MAVAAIAWNDVTPSVRTGAKRLLKLNPEWNRWVDGASKDKADEVRFTGSSSKRW